MTPPEFSRPVRIDSLGEAPRTIAVEAQAGERGALAERFGYLAIDSLSAEVVLVRKGDAVIARGTLRAALTQACVASGEPVDETVDAPFEVEFRPHPADADPEDEIELAPGEMDVVFYGGAQIDVGEAVAETLSLSVEPYPRSAAAEAALREAGVLREEEAAAESSPFAALRDKLGKG